MNVTKLIHHAADKRRKSALIFKKYRPMDLQCIPTTRRLSAAADHAHRRPVHDPAANLHLDRIKKDEDNVSEVMMSYYHSL